MVTFPHCKINLGLHILAKRADGYHDIETCFYPVPWQDIVEVIPSDVFSFSSSGISIPGSDEDNQCIKAYRLFKQEFNLPPVQIHLHKIIPTGAGLGGGSSDGTFTLRALNSVFELGLSAERIKIFAARLGSDSPFFVEDVPMMGSGRGEILSPTTLSLKGYFLVLIKPPIHVSTAEAYANITPALPYTPLSEVIALPVSEWKNKLVNDFEKSVFEKFPAIERIKNTLYEQGALYACMSGSGSSVFGVFTSTIDLKKMFSGMDYWAGELN